MIFKFSINSNVKKIIHTSTSEVYGTPNYIPIDEKHLVKLNLLTQQVKLLQIKPVLSQIL